MVALLLSPAERILRAKLAAHSLHAQRDSRELTANARSTFLRRFDDEVDPDRVLSSRERQRRAIHARSVYFLALALRSSKARRRKRGRSEKQLVSDPLLLPETAM